MKKYTYYIFLFTILLANLLIVSCDDIIWIWDSDETKAVKKAKFYEKEKLSDQSKKIKKNDLEINPNLDENLMKISPHAAILYTDLYLKKDLNCLALNKLIPNFKEKEYSIKNDHTKVLLSDLQKNIKIKCNFYKSVIDHTDNIFSKIKIDGSLPKEVFIFKLYFKGDDSNEFLYKEEEIGLFLSIGDCERFENLARTYNFATKKCNLFENKKLN